MNENEATEPDPQELLQKLRSCNGMLNDAYSLLRNVLINGHQLASGDVALIQREKSELAETLNRISAVINVAEHPERASRTEQSQYNTPPTLEAWTTAMTNLAPLDALQLRDHAIRREKKDPRWNDFVKVAERILRERGISR